MASKRGHRHYAPDYVSADTLAYRLDCSRSTIDEYARSGLLPKPQVVGNLQRWDFAEVCAYIRDYNLANMDVINGEDEYMRGLGSVSTKES